MTSKVTRDIFQSEIADFFAGVVEIHTELGGPNTVEEAQNQLTDRVLACVPEVDSEPVAWRWRSGPNAWWQLASRGDIDGEVEPLYRHAQPAPVVPDEMLCEFYEVSNWTDLVRELVKHVEQLQDSAKRNVKPWEDTFPETLLPAYIERVKQADDACRSAQQPVVPHESYQQLSELYHAQEKRLFKIAQHIKGPAFDKYSHSPSQAIDVLEVAIFGEDESCRAAMLHAASVCTCPSGDGSLRWPCPSHPGNSPVIPEGYVMVPKEPTSEMIWAAKYCFTSTPGWDVFKSAYIAMLAAAPQEAK